MHLSVHARESMLIIDNPLRELEGSKSVNCSFDLLSVNGQLEFFHLHGAHELVGLLRREALHFREHVGHRRDQPVDEVLVLDTFPVHAFAQIHGLLLLQAFHLDLLFELVLRQLLVLHHLEVLTNTS